MTWPALPQDQLPPPSPSRWRREHDQLIAVLVRLLAVGMSLALAGATVFSSGIGMTTMFALDFCGRSGTCDLVPMIAVGWMIGPWVITFVTGVVASLVWDRRPRGLVVLGLGLVAQAVVMAVGSAVMDTV